MILGVQGGIAYFTVCLNESYFNIMAKSCSEMHFMRKQFVNKRIKHLLGKKSSNPAVSNPNKNFVPIMPFKIIFLVKKRYYGNEGFCLAWDGRKVS